MFYGKKEMTRVGLTESHELFKSGEIFHLAVEDRVIEFPSMLKVWGIIAGLEMEGTTWQGMRATSRNGEFPLLIDSKEMAPQAHNDQELSPAYILRELGS